METDAPPVETDREGEDQREDADGMDKQPCSSRHTVVTA